MKTIIAIIIARVASFASRVLGKGSGSALPGLIVEKINPEFLKSSLEKLPQGVVLVTGTNGKTTTTKMIVELMEQNGVRVLTNKSGSNFTRGILSMLVRHTALSGRLPFDIAILEMDEAYAAKIARLVPPKFVVALNVHRDQLDRYGEIKTTARMIGDAMQYARFVIVNGDDVLLVHEASRAAEGGATIGYFGASKELLADLPSDDDLHGGNSDDFRPPQFLVELSNYEEDEITLKVDGIEHKANFRLPGVYNALNAAAAIMTVVELLPKQGHQGLVTALANLKPAFGRGETFNVKGKEVVFGLVKNPSGFNHNLKTMVYKANVILIAINDDYADGRDVSWLWDVHFDQFKNDLSERKIIVSGVRADDMVLRLSESGIEAELVDDLAVALTTAKNAVPPSGNLTIFPTYTAMLALRGELAKEVEVADIW